LNVPFTEDRLREEITKIMGNLQAVLDRPDPLNNVPTADSMAERRATNLGCTVGDRKSAGFNLHYLTQDALGFSEAGQEALTLAQQKLIDELEKEVDK